MSTTVAAKWIYDFAEGSRDMRELLGGKGSGIAEMTRVLGPDLVPAGFTITTEACVEYMRADRTEPEGLAAAIDAALARLEERAGKSLGDPDNPLLVSVRSGARDSMPGMMDTVLNLGLNDEAVEGLAERTGNPRFAWDSYRRLVQMFGGVVRGVPSARFEDEIARIKRERGVTLDTELDTDALRELTTRFKALYDFPTDPREQLEQAIRAVFDSWMGERAVAYRRINDIPDDWGTAVNVQQMVYGNKGPTSGSGVAFSRDEVTGAPEPSGDFLIDAQGEDVVSGVRTPRDLSELRDWMPEAHAQLLDIMRTLERHYGDMQDTEFTIEEGRLYMLQTRNAKRPAQAAVRFAVDAVGEGLLSREQAIATIEARSLHALLHPTFDPDGRVRGRRPRRRRLAGRGQGRHRLHRARRGRRGRGRARGHPRASLHRGRRRRRLPRRQGHPHLRGRQGVARGARGPRHGLPRGHRRRRAGHRPARPRGAHRRARPARGRPRSPSTARAGTITLDDVALVTPEVDPRFDTLLAVVRRAAHARRARQRRHARGRAPRARLRRRGRRAVPHRAHVHGRRPPAQDAADDHGRRRGRPARGARRAARRCSRTTSRRSSRRWRACRSPSGCSTRRCTSSCPTAMELVEQVTEARLSGAPETAELEHTLERVRGARRGQPDARHARRAAGADPSRDLRDAGARDLPRHPRGARAHRPRPARRGHDPARRLRRASSRSRATSCCGWPSRRASSPTATSCWAR